MPILKNRLPAYLSFYLVYYLWLIRSSFGLASIMDLLLALIMGAIAVKITTLEFQFHNKALPVNARWLIFFTWPISGPGILLYLKKAWGLAHILLHFLLLFGPVLLYDIYRAFSY